MRPLSESDLVLNEEVIVINPASPNFDRVGYLWKISRYTHPPRVQVYFDDDGAYRYRLTDLTLA